MGVRGRVEVESSGEEGEENSKLLVGSGSGFEESGEDRDLLSSVGVLVAGANEEEVKEEGGKEGREGKRGQRWVGRAS